ncbi:MAG: hypothetical protein K2N63_02560 [Lachnospiraceae bacterium]|nr:hypothetical protein [Lachnospiraceae bacterium]
MNEQSYEPEIRIGKVLYRIFRDWRKILVIAFTVSVIVGGGNFVLKRIKTSDGEYLKKVEENFSRELAAFEATGETLLREIVNLEETRTQREEYNASSILMKINPFREFNASLQLYIATNYQIVPELTYQNIDLSNRILRSYITYMVNGGMYQYIMERLSQPVELRYLKEVLSISPDYDNRMVMLSVRHVDAQACEEILDYAMEAIKAKQSEIVAAIGEHQLNSVNQAVYEAVDLELDEWQKANIQYVSDLSIKLQEKAEEYTKWEASEKPRKDYTNSGIIKNSVKKMILGFLVGAVLAAAYLAFHYIVSDKLKDADDLKGRFGLRVIAQIPGMHKSRAFVGFDRLFARLFGLPFRAGDGKVLAKLAAGSVQAELSAWEIEKEKGGKFKDGNEKSLKLVFTGTVAFEEMKKLLAEMGWENNTAIQCVPSILHDPDAVPAVMDADYVILVEEQEKSTYSRIERELEELSAWRKKVLGVIVVGVDAIP